MIAVKEAQTIVPHAGNCEFTCDYPGCNALCKRPSGHQGFCNCGRHAIDLPMPSYLSVLVTRFVEIIRHWTFCPLSCDHPGCRRSCVRQSGHFGDCDCGTHSAALGIATFTEQENLSLNWVSCGMTHQGCGGHCMNPSRHRGEHYCGICEKLF